jgi:hypothetical protein
VALRLSRPGYAATHLDVSDTPALVSARLVPISGFEGVWLLPDGKLRQFERRGEQVAGFRLHAAEGPREFVRMFEFASAAGDGVVFVASEPFVDERAPEEPSCNIPLRAEYRYRPADDSLELRKEKARYTLSGGHCVMQAMAWSDARRLDRIAGATADAVWAESRAGGARPVSKKVPPPRTQPLKQEPPPSKNQAPAPPSKNQSPAPNLDEPPDQQLMPRAQQAAPPRK